MKNKRKFINVSVAIDNNGWRMMVGTCDDGTVWVSENMCSWNYFGVVPDDNTSDVKEEANLVVGAEVLSELHKEKNKWDHIINSEKLGGNIVKENYAKGAASGLTAAEAIITDNLNKRLLAVPTITDNSPRMCLNCGEYCGEYRYKHLNVCSEECGKILDDQMNAMRSALNGG